MADDRYSAADMAVLQPDWPAPSRVKAMTTLRGGGYSRGPYAGFNLADHVGDEAAAVAANRARLHAAMPAAPAWLTQVHGTRCLRADTALPGAEADASYTDTTTHACVVLTADCLPLLLCDIDGSTVAAAHAGWRGLAAGVIEATVAALDRPPGRLLAWLGPAIGPRAFEVGDEVRTTFVEEDAAAAASFAAGRFGKWYGDLYGLARLRLTRLGVTRIYGGDRCTASEPAEFFSYRRDGTTGRMATLIWLEP